ncbi:hypothetical protein E4T71_09565, partial [Streptococcus sp. WM07]
WSAYRTLKEASLVGCWAHVRRKFFEATPKNANSSSLAKKGSNTHSESKLADIHSLWTIDRKRVVDKLWITSCN